MFRQYKHDFQDSFDEFGFVLNMASIPLGCGPCRVAGNTSAAITFMEISADVSDGNLNSAVVGVMKLVIGPAYNKLSP